MGPNEEERPPTLFNLDLPKLIQADELMRITHRQKESYEYEKIPAL